MPDLNQVYHELGELKGATEANGKRIDTLCVEIKKAEETREKRFDTIMEKLTGEDKRIAALERWRSWTAGVGTIVLLGIGAGAGWLRFLRGSGGPPA